MFRFESGDKVKVVNEEECRKLDKLWMSRKSHVFMAGKEVTIQEKVTGVSYPVYTIEEAEGYFWEDDYFER